MAVTKAQGDTFYEQVVLLLFLKEGTGLYNKHAVCDIVSLPSSL